MNQKLLTFEELAAQLLDVAELVTAQQSARLKAGEQDGRIDILHRRLKALTISSFLSQTSDEEGGNSEIGKVVSFAGKQVEVKKQATDPVSDISEIGKVVSKAIEPEKTLDEKKEGATAIANNEFLEGLKGKSVEKLASGQYSKDALIQIIKTINEKLEEKIEVADGATKVVLAEAIYAHFNPSEPKSE